MRLNLIPSVGRLCIYKMQRLRGLTIKNNTDSPLPKYIVRLLQMKLYAPLKKTLPLYTRG